MELHTEVKSELNKTLLRIRVPDVTGADYQIRMLQANRIQGILPVNMRVEGQETVYEYEITGMVTMQNAYKREKITEGEMKNFLKKIQETIQSVEKYLLDSNRILLDPELILKKDEAYYFCYMPKYEGSIRDGFHKLMEHFVQWTDYQDMDSVQTAFLLHKETMKDNYSLSGIIEKLGELEKANEKVDKEMNENQEELWKNSEYDTEEHDWITSQEMGSKILKETDNLWSPVKKLLNKHKRPKWGDWDGIYIDEDEL